MKKVTLILPLLLLLINSCSDEVEKERIYSFDKKMEVGKINDIEGNTYGTVTYQINDKEKTTWMTENLRVMKFKNGDSIFYCRNEEDWEKASEKLIPACLYIDFDEKNKEYGLFYNFQAISDLRGIAPEGWHITENKDWADLWNKITPAKPEFQSSGDTDNPNEVFFISNQKNVYKEKYDYSKEKEEKVKFEFNSAKLNLTPKGYIKKHLKGYTYSMDFEMTDGFDLGYYWISDHKLGELGQGKKDQLLIEIISGSGGGYITSWQVGGLKNPAFNVRCVKN